MNRFIADENIQAALSANSATPDTTLSQGLKRRQQESETMSSLSCQPESVGSY
jgi:hypothetical protein